MYRDRRGLRWQLGWTHHGWVWAFQVHSRLLVQLECRSEKLVGRHEKSLVDVDKVGRGGDVGDLRVLRDHSLELQRELLQASILRCAALAFFLRNQDRLGQRVDSANTLNHAVGHLACNH